MFGIGPAELLILLIIGTLAIGVPVAIIVLLVVLLRKNNSGDQNPSYSQLRDENHRLREELAALQQKNT